MDEELQWAESPLPGVAGGMPGNGTDSADADIVGVAGIVAVDRVTDVDIAVVVGKGTDVETGIPAEYTDNSSAAYQSGLGDDWSIALLHLAGIAQEQTLLHRRLPWLFLATKIKGLSTQCVAGISEECEDVGLANPRLAWRVRRIVQCQDPASTFFGDFYNTRYRSIGVSISLG